MTLTPPYPLRRPSANYFRFPQAAAPNSTRAGVPLVLSTGGGPPCMTLSKRVPVRGLATVFRGRFPIRGGKVSIPVLPLSSATHLLIRLPARGPFGRVGEGSLIQTSRRRWG